MGLFKDINDSINELLCGSDIKSTREQEKKMAMARIEQERREKIAKAERRKIEKETRKKEWPNVKEEIYSRHKLPIADDAKNVAKDLFGKDVDIVSAFFITDERIVKKIYINGGDMAIDEYAKNLMKRAFIDGPITATLLRRLKLLEDAKRDGDVIDTEIDIDGYTPNGKIVYAVNKVELDGQIIPARRKFSIRCEMTATITEGFRIGPFVMYDELYMSTKEEMEQITDEDIETNEVSEANEKNKTSKISKTSRVSKTDKIHNGNSDAYEGRKYGRKYNLEVCHHGTDKVLYCSQCHGDIIISPSKKKIIGICLDTSGSMHGERLVSAKKAVTRVLERIPADSDISVVLTIFDSDLSMNREEIIPFGNDYTPYMKSSAINRISTIRTGGGTPLYDTINYFLDEIWPGVSGVSEVSRISGVSGVSETSNPTKTHFLLDENRILFPYTYLIIVSDGEENQSLLKNIIYKGRTDKEGFFLKLRTYRDAGLITDIIPLAYGDRESNTILIQELKKISGKQSISVASPESIIESLLRNVDAILCGNDHLKMMGLSMGGKDND